MSGYSDFSIPAVWCAAILLLTTGSPILGQPSLANSPSERTNRYFFGFSKSMLRNAVHIQQRGEEAVERIIDYPFPRPESQNLF